MCQFFTYLNKMASIIELQHLYVRPRYVNKPEVAADSYLFPLHPALGVGEKRRTDGLKRPFFRNLAYS